MAWHQVFCLLLVVGVVCGQTVRQQTCSKLNTADIQPGSQALLGGILSMSRRGTDGFGCGSYSGSMQALESIRWVLDLLNKKNEFLQTEFLTDTYVPGVTLGMKVVNPCKNTMSAVASLGEIYQGLHSSSQDCSRQNDQMVFGIVGGSTSDEAMEMSLAMQPQDIPLVSYEATAPQITLSDMYPNFMRTVAPDSLMTEVILQVMLKLDWKYIVIVYDSSTFGKGAFSELHTKMVAAGLCLRQGIPVDSNDLTTGNMDSALNSVLSTGATGVVYFGPYELAKALLERSNDRMPVTGRLQWIFTDFPIDTSLDIEYMRGIISITSAYRFIVEFEDHWIRIDESNPSAENPWYQSWFAEKNDCSFTPVGSERDCKNLNPGLSEKEKEAKKRREFQQDQYVEPAVMAVFTYAKALRTAQMDKCAAGVACPDLINMDRKEFYENYLKKVDFTFSSDERVPSLASRNILPYNAAKHLSFTEHGDIVNPSFYIWNFNDVESGVSTGSYHFKRIGNYINQFLTFNPTDIVMYNNQRAVRLTPPPSSLCPSLPCSNCMGLPSDVKYYYVPGDITFAGIFSLHEKGATPLSCGSLVDKNQVMYLEAMVYALNSINNDNSILPNIRLGGLGIDDCSSEMVGQSLMSQILRGNLMIKDANQNPLNPRTIEAYTAAYKSHLTDPLAKMMNYLKRPLVGYRSGSVKLDDQAMYPYFIRSAPYIHEEVRAIILLLKNYGWMYVQVVTADGDYSMDALKVFRDMAAREGICVVATHNMDKTSSANIVDGLAVHPNAPVVVTLVEQSYYHHLLPALHANLAVRGTVTVVANTAWNKDAELIQGMEATAQGIITLSLKRSTLQSFLNYLRTLKAATYKENPWFMEWFSQAYDCSLGSAAGGKPVCDLDKVLNDGSMFEVLYEVESVINGVKALARALDQTLSFYCGNGYTAVCSTFSSAADKGLKYMEFLRQTTFQIEDMVPPTQFRFMGSSAVIPFEVNNIQGGGVYVKAGDITPWDNSVSMTTAVVLFNGATPADVQTTCLQPCLECLYMFNHQDIMTLDGDIMIATILNVHYAGSGIFSCGDMRIKNGALYTEVLNFAFDYINNAAASSVKLLNNVKLGFFGFDGCSNPTRSLAIMNGVSAGFFPLPIEKSIMSWITYDSETTKEAALFLQQLQMPLVSPAATLPELADKSKYTTLFRTINSDAIVAKGMADFVNSMGWKFVFVLNSPDASNRAASRLFLEYLKGYGICVLAQYEFVSDGSMNVILSSINAAESQVVAVFAEPDQHIREMLETIDKAGVVTKELRMIANRPWTPYETLYSTVLTNSVFFHPTMPTINEFLTYLRSRDIDNSNNPWLKDIYEELFDCDSPGSFTSRPACIGRNELPSSTRFSVDIWTLSSINAVYALASGLHTLLIEKCGTGYSGVCPAFRQDSDTRERLMNIMDNIKFKDIVDIWFEFVERESNRGYKLHRYTSVTTIVSEGELSHSGVLTLGDKATLMNRYVGIKSDCPGQCVVCQDNSASVQDFTLIPGDVYIIGLFDVHKKGATPFSCAGINDKHGVALLEAFHFALDYVNNRKGIFNDFGIQIGGVGLDMCQSPTLAANLVANIHSGKVTLNKESITISPRNIDAYIATMDTESSVRVADILNQLLIPQISYGATGMDLLDREKYSYFLRSVPADDKMGRAMISYLKKFGYNNIQVIKSFDEIGEPGAKEFERLAEVNMVCITKKFLVGEHGDIQGDVRKIINEIQVQPSAQVVVLWMKNPIPVLEVVNAYEAVYKNMLFVATDKWGADPDYLTHTPIFNLLQEKNLILLDVETADVPGYDHYLAEKTPDNYPLNPWYKEYYEMMQKCNWDAGTCNKFKTIPRLDNYVQDPYVLYVVNAVFAAAMGIRNAVRELCVKSQHNGVCNFYSTSGERRQKTLEYMKKVRFVDDTHQPFFFMEDGQSDRGFHFFNVTDAKPGHRYENVGSYNDTHFLKLDITYDNDFNAHCDAMGKGTTGSADDCTCPFKPDLPTRFMKKEEGERGLTLVYVGDIHKGDPMDPYGCGKINTGVDLHRLLAFFYAIDRINANADFDLQDSLRLDGVALDTCTTSLRLGQDVYNILSGNKLCESDEPGQVISPSSIAAFIVDKDQNALPISTMLSAQGITSISPTATTALLDDPFVHATFLRTHSSDREMSQIIMNIADKLRWDLMGVIYTDSVTHRSAKESLLKESTHRNRRVCMGTMASLKPDATIDDATDALDTISKQIGVTGVVLFVEPAHFRLLMESSRILGSTGIVWVVTSDWDTAKQDASRYLSELTGSIWIQGRSVILDDFNKYIQKLSLDNHMGIPDDWFQEIYETIHNCRILNLEKREALLHSNICDGTEKMNGNMLKQDPSILHVIVSVYAAALGLNSVPQCSDTNLGVAACLQLRAEKNALIYDNILNVNFKVLPKLLGDKAFDFAFNDDGNGEAGFFITSLNETRHFSRLGEYTSAGLDISLKEFEKVFSYEQGGLPSSNCAPGAICSCFIANGETDVFIADGVSITLKNVEVNKRYRDPETGEIILVEGIPETTDRFKDIWAIVVMVVAGIGCAVAIVLFVYLLVMYPVRGGTSILGYIVSFGIVLLYLMVFPFIAHADDRICGLRRFGLGAVYAIVYSALLVKLIDCWRVRGKDDAYSAKYSKLGRPCGLFFVTVFLILIQCMINAQWLIMREPETERVFYENLYWPRCTPDDFYDEGLVLSLTYVMALIILSFLLGICTFTMTLNHREARWIFGIIGLSIPCWVIWCLVATLGPYKTRDAAVAIGLVINATFMLLLMPVRKLYLLSKYNALIEEEDKQAINDYQSVYGRQYDNTPQMHAGSTIDYNRQAEDSVRY